MRNLLCAGVLIGIVAAGCSPTQQAQVDQKVQGVRQDLGSAAANAQRAAVDAALEAKVKSALETRKGLNAKAIDVEAKAGQVVLKGDIASREEADIALRVAQETEGVVTVDNQLTMRVPVNSLPAAGAQPASTQPGTTY